MQTVEQWLRSRTDKTYINEEMVVTLKDALVALEWLQLENDIAVYSGLKFKDRTEQSEQQLSDLKQKHNIL